MKLIMLLFATACSSVNCFSQSAEEIIRLLDDTLKKDPRNSEILFVRGMTWLESEKYDSAITDFTKALQYLYLKSAPASRDNKPIDSTDILVSRAYCYDLVDSVDKSVSDYRYLQTVQPNDFMFSIAVARVYIKHKEFSKAKIEIKRLKSFQDNERGLVYEAILFYEEEKYDDGLIASDIAIKKFPNSIEGFLIKARILSKLKRPEEACMTASEALQKITLEYFGGEQGYMRDFEEDLQNLKKTHCRQ